MALIIPLCLTLLWTSIVSALSILSPGRTQPPIELDPVSGSLHNSTTHGRINNSILSLPTDGVLDRAYNISLPGLNLSAEPVIDCDEGWGRDLNTRICWEAFATVPASMAAEGRAQSFGPRAANTFDIGLPRRWMSSDGICAIQPFVVPEKESALVAPASVYLATYTLIKSCVGGNPSAGGQARDLGGDNNLLVTVSEFDPYLWSDNVRCFGSTGRLGILESCNGLADRMQASHLSRTFGPPGTHYDYRTPYTLTADNRCYLTVTNHPNNRSTRKATWYQIWEAAILVNAMCVRQGKKGAFKIFSSDMDERWLEVEMGDLEATDNLTLSLTSV